MRRERCKNAAPNATSSPHFLTMYEAALQQDRIC
jgi:hypothetical protein